MPKLEIENKKKYVTVGEMLEYIHTHDISMDALVLVEQLKDYYMENKDDSKNWDYYQTDQTPYDFPEKLIPIHNGFGSAFYKKAFVLWMHF